MDRILSLLPFRTLGGVVLAALMIAFTCVGPIIVSEEVDRDRNGDCACGNEGAAFGAFGGDDKRRCERSSMSAPESCCILTCLVGDRCLCFEGKMRVSGG